MSWGWKHKNSSCVFVCVCCCCILLLKWHQSAKKAITLSEMWQTHVLVALCSLPSVSLEKQKKITALFYLPALLCVNGSEQMAFLFAFADDR